MEKYMSKIVYITGCLGFIGQHITRSLLQKKYFVIGIDNETYASNTELLSNFKTYKNFSYIKQDISVMTHLEDCDYVINTAAETHVDNSISNSDQFLKTNINGVTNLLNLIRTKPAHSRPCFFQFSTDEVYGDSSSSGKFTELSSLKPSNPYSASKASADMMILAWHRTFGIPYIIVRPTNNFGIGQHAEKFIPKAIKYLTLQKKFPLYKNGNVKRTWLHVYNTVSAVEHLINDKYHNEIYNINGFDHETNLNVFQQILEIMNYNPYSWKDFILEGSNRMGHDLDYTLDDSKLRNTGWEPSDYFKLDITLHSIVNYYTDKFKI